jgi:hypothetical protein
MAPLDEDRPVAETSTSQHTRGKPPCPRRDSNPQSQQASDRRPRLYHSFLNTEFLGYKQFRSFSLYLNVVCIKIFPEPLLVQFDTPCWNSILLVTTQPKSKYRCLTATILFTLTNTSISWICPPTAPRPTHNFVRSSYGGFCNVTLIRHVIETRRLVRNGIICK